MSLLKLIGFLFKIAEISLLNVLAKFIPKLLHIQDLPKSSGEFQVGTLFLSFSDKERKGIINNSSKERELSVQVWYPADKTNQCEILNYFPHKEMAACLAKAFRTPNFYKRLKNIKTNSYFSAPLSIKKEKYPVLLFSHGFTGFSGQNTILMEELASQGYIIFSIAHTYEACFSMFPDEKLISFDKAWIDMFNKDLMKSVKDYPGDNKGPDSLKFSIEHSNAAKTSMKIWTEDTIYITNEIERLAKEESSSMFSGRLDMNALGIFGHSFGGAAAGEVCIRDDRFKAFINMDGAPYGGGALHNIIKQPFMIMTSESNNNIPSGYHPEQKDYIYINIKGSKHFDYTDFSILMPEFKRAGLLLGEIEGKRQMEIVNAYVLAFFNKYIKGMDNLLMYEQLRKYEEVSIKKNC